MSVEREIALYAYNKFNKGENVKITEIQVSKKVLNCLKNCELITLVKLDQGDELQLINQDNIIELYNYINYYFPY